MKLEAKMDIIAVLLCKHLTEKCEFKGNQLDFCLNKKKR